jgi:hypothetical protein
MRTIQNKVGNGAPQNQTDQVIYFFISAGLDPGNPNKESKMK